MIARIVLSTVALAALTVGGASAQGYRPGWPYRGDGIWYDLSGNVAAAVANSINTDTEIRRDQYRREQYDKLSERTKHVLYRRQMTKGRQQETNRRLRESPTERDLFQGDALNVLLVDLLNPKGSLSEVRVLGGEIDVRTIQQIPFVFRGQGVQISLGRLHVQKGDWPRLLQDLAFDRERDSYVKAVDQALEENVQRGQLKPATILVVQDAVKVLSDKVQVVVAKKPEFQRFLTETTQFLERLKYAAEILDRKVVTDVIADLDRFSSPKLVDLLEFMRNYELMFAEAKNPEERRIYAEIFEELKRMRNEYAKLRPELFRVDWLS